MRTPLRILILFSFLAPFLTCNEFVEPIATSTTSDSSLVKDSSVIQQDSLKNLSSASKESASPAPSPDDRSFLKKLLGKIVYPTNNSISGIGSILLFPVLSGQIILGISFVLSLFLIFAWRFLKRKKRRLFLTGLNTILIVTLIMIGLLTNDVEFLWGVWLLLALAITETTLEYRYQVSSLHSV